jgi:hypothetical protein
MALITESSRAPCGAEGLAGAGASPDSADVAPACEPEGIGPDSNPGEEVTLLEASEVVSSNIDN